MRRSPKWSVHRRAVVFLVVIVAEASAVAAVRTVSRLMCSAPCGKRLRETASPRGKAAATN